MTLQLKDFQFLNLLVKREFSSMHLLYCIFSLIQYISVKSLRLFFCFSALVKLHLLHRCLSTFVCRCVKLGLLNHVTYCFYWEIEKICLLPDLLNADCVPVNVVTKPPSSWDSLCSLFVCVIYSVGCAEIG